MVDPEQTGGPFELESIRLGALPVVGHFLARMGLEGTLERHLPAGDARTEPGWVLRRPG